MNAHEYKYCGIEGLLTLRDCGINSIKNILYLRELFEPCLSCLINYDLDWRLNHSYSAENHLTLPSFFRGKLLEGTEEEKPPRDSTPWGPQYFFSPFQGFLDTSDPKPPFAST